MRGRIAALVLLMLVTASGAAAWFFWQRAHVANPPQAGVVPSDDPRLTYPTRYRNVRPEVQYVGDAACAGCHLSESSSYHRHPMAHSMSVVSQAVPVERYDAAASNPFAKAGFDFAIERRGDQVALSVTDQGDGIAPSERERVLAPFYRLDKARTPGEAARGFGLGLTLASRVAQVHHGAITIGPAETIALTIPL